MSHLIRDSFVGQRGAFGALVGLSVALFVKTAPIRVFAADPPFNRGQPHFDVAIPPDNYNPSEGPILIVLGLSWIEMPATNPTWKGYHADALLCGRWITPFPNDHYVTISVQNPGFDWFENPGNPPGESHVPPHGGNTCKWLANWSNSPQDNPTIDVTFTVTVQLRDTGGNVVDSETYQVRVVILGGPMKIDMLYHAEKDVSFQKHRANDVVEEGDVESLVELTDEKHPWYATDFNYNPFHYRNQSGAGYTIGGLQLQNSWKAVPLWSQPSDARVQYHVTLPGTLLNADAELADAGGVPNPRTSAFLQPATLAKVGMNGELDSPAEFGLSATYFLGEPSGTGPHAPVAYDDSGKFYELQDEVAGKPWRDSIHYADFRVHRPTGPPEDLSSLLSSYTSQIPPGMIGLRKWFVLKDQFGLGMPGVWVQERFIGYLDGFGDELPAGFQTNLETGKKWITQQRPFPASFLASSPFTADDGGFNGTDDMWFWPQNPTLTLLHEYWAATDVCARKLADYPWRIVPGTQPQVKRYLGMWIASYDMVATTTTVTHTPGQRHSGDGPPP